MKSLSIPCVNMNGTSAQELVEQNMKVVRRLRAAVEDMREACPHGRDYQHLLPSRDDWSAHNLAVTEAQDAWRQRVVAISRIADEFEQVAVAVSMQASARRAG